MRILDFLPYDGIIASLKARTKTEVLIELVEPVARANPQIERSRLMKTLLDRENIGSTGIGGGVAIPHGKFDGLEKIAASFGRSAEGLDFGSMDNRPAYLFFLVVAPKHSASDHLKALARISRLFKDPILKMNLQRAESQDDIYRLLEEYDLRLP